MNLGDDRAGDGAGGLEAEAGGSAMSYEGLGITAQRGRAGSGAWFPAEVVPELGDFLGWAGFQLDAVGGEGGTARSEGGWDGRTAEIQGRAVEYCNRWITSGLCVNNGLRQT
jgi:hypothetical protein